MPARGHHKLGRKREAPSRTLERFMLFVAIGEPLMTLPQIYDLYRPNGSKDVSIATWILYLGASIMWLFYGLKCRNMPLIVSGVLWVVMEALVVVGIFLR